MNDDLLSRARAGSLKIGDQISTLSSVGSNVGPTKFNALKQIATNANGDVELRSQYLLRNYLPRVGGASLALDRQIKPEQLAKLGIAANDNKLFGGLPNAKPVPTFAGKPLTIIDVLKDNAAKRVYNLEIESLAGENTHNYFVGDDLAWVHNAAWRIAAKLRDRGFTAIPGDQKKTPCGCRKNYMKGKLTVSIDCNEDGYEPWPHIDVKRPGKPKIRIPWSNLK